MKHIILSSMLLLSLAVTAQVQKASIDSPKPQLSDFKIFPNPNKDKIYVNLETESNNTYRIALIDVSGNELKSFVYTNLSGSQIIEISTRGVDEGTYYISITNTVQTVNKTVYIR